MKRIAWVALVACSSGPHELPRDAPGIDGACVYTSPCNPLFQFGCSSAAEKCTWLLAGSDLSVGFIGCTLAGSAAVGQPCQYAVASRPGCGTYAADDCVKGAVCSDGICAPICDNQGGNPMCDEAHACVVDPALFSTGMTSPHAAGVCVPACDPLADNDFLGSGVRGSGCVTGSGCYGVPSGGTPPLTQFGCQPDGSASLVHRSVVDGSLGLAVNACAEGYEPLVHDTTGSTTIVCVALCAPGDTYLGGPQAPLGVAPHRCAATDARGTFGSGEHCMYLWRLEQDGSGNWLPSPSSNTVGVCIDHAQYRYDSNGDGVIDGSDATWPDCASLPLGSAAELGCVSTTTAPALPGTPPPGL